MALQANARNWLDKALGRRTIKNPVGVPNYRCANCGHEVTGVGPEPTNCPGCGQPWQSA
jgi:rubrerythrin